MISSSSLLNTEAQCYIYWSNVETTREDRPILFYLIFL